MAFVASAAVRGAAGKQAAGAAGKKAAGSAAGGSAFGTAARARQDPQLAKELADLNGETPAAPKAPASEPAPSGGGGQSSGGGGGGPKGSPGAGLKSATARLSDTKGTPGWYRGAAKVADPTYALNAGGGALLGVLAWMVGLTYLREGKPGVQRWVRAKFFNEVSGS